MGPRMQAGLGDGSPRSGDWVEQPAPDSAAAAVQWAATQPIDSKVFALYTEVDITYHTTTTVGWQVRQLHRKPSCLTQFPPVVGGSGQTGCLSAAVRWAAPNHVKQNCRSWLGGVLSCIL